jgi:serine/threonine-protein kinase HipA
MNRCPITYEICGNQKYSTKGLQLLSKGLKDLQDFPYTANEQIERAVELAAKLSIQGVQPKLSVRLLVSREVFEIVERNGSYILKPPHQIYNELPQNEDLTMRMASAVGLEIPFHGMIYTIDGSLSYFIKRFDRTLRGAKLAVEDFSQLLGNPRDTKYDSSMEKVITLIEKFCTFPAIEKLKIFRLTMFNFLVGNEDMHLKNFSLITRKNKVELSPCYDLLNSSIVLRSKEEIALPLRGKKSKLNYADLVEYFGQTRLGLQPAAIMNELHVFHKAIPLWYELLERSFLSRVMREKYRSVIEERWQRIQKGYSLNVAMER